MEHIYEVFRERWEVGSQFHGLGEFRTELVSDNQEFYKPILAAEVVENLAKMSNGMALGPYRVSKKGLLNWEPREEQLAWLFMTWLVHGVILRAFKECRTSLLPKCTDPRELRDVNGWQPVTIGSVVLQLFSQILAMRMTQVCPLNPRQRGFLDPLIHRLEQMTRFGL